MTIIAITKETHADETRFAASIDTVKKWVSQGLRVNIESGTGLSASVTDQALESAGAIIVKTAKEALKDADLILKVRAPSTDEIKAMKKGAIVIALMDAYREKETLIAMAKAGLSAYAMEFVPRITRAQVMDALSSQANLAGYRCVIEAANAFGKAMPMMMTAAGTIAPAKVFIMGVGVAGLQAIATAKRLGAVVTATDVRPATKEQVESLGAKFLAIEDEEFKNAQTSGGYAKEMSAAYQQKQAELISSHIAKQDIVITTALIPGRPAPVLVTSDQVASMKPGSILLDLAATQGGNIEGSKIGETVDIDGVKILAPSNILSSIAQDASNLYAKNLLAFTGLLIDKDGTLIAESEDEILKSALIVHGGEIVHSALKGS